MGLCKSIVVLLLVDVLLVSTITAAGQLKLLKVHLQASGNDLNSFLFSSLLFCSPPIDVI